MPNNPQEEQQNNASQEGMPAPEQGGVRKEGLEARVEREAGQEEERALPRRSDRAEALKQRVAQVKLTPQEEEEARTHKQEIAALERDAQVQRLLQIAEEKSVVYAVKVAVDLDDAYTLDRLHDVLAMNEKYKEFLK